MELSASRISNPEPHGDAQNTGTQAGCLIKSHEKRGEKLCSDVERRQGGERVKLTNPYIIVDLFISAEFYFSSSYNQRSYSIQTHRAHLAVRL